MAAFPSLPYEAFAYLNQGRLQLEEEEEIDELDSDSDLGRPEPEEVQAPSGSRKKKAEQRRAGQTLISPEKLEDILQADGMSVNMSKEASFMMSIATEEFVKRLAQAGNRRAQQEQRSTVQYNDLATVAHQQKPFNILQDTIPRPIPLSIALVQRAAKERELLESDPATIQQDPEGGSSLPALLSSAMAAAAAATAGPSQPSASSSRTKSKATDDSSLDGSNASGQRKERKRDNRGRWSTGGSETPTETPFETPPAQTTSNGTSSRSRRSKESTSARARAQASSSSSSHPHSHHPPSQSQSHSRSYTHHPHTHTHSHSSHTRAHTHPHPQPHPQPHTTHARTSTHIPTIPASYTLPTNGHHPSWQVLVSRPSSQTPEPWAASTAYGTPASEFLGSVTRNPGRTIYSSQRPIPDQDGS